MNTPKRLVFLTGTRADFGKLKSLIKITQASPDFEVHVFVTGMHMLRQYGMTCIEIDKSGIQNQYRFINQSGHDSMDVILAKTIGGLSDYIKEIRPDLLIVHGDRVEALAGAITGALNNVLVAHIEGGEVSGTIDELIRHAVTKMSHIHLVANEEAGKRLLQLGERDDSIHVIGSPDFDVMFSPDLPAFEKVSSHYQLPEQPYGILLFHPVTTAVDRLPAEVEAIVAAVKKSVLHWLVVYPNNDHGSEIILEGWQSLADQPNVQLFPSIRFEYFLVLLKHAVCMMGNSSAGVREAPAYGVPSINLGPRQHNRAFAETIINAPCEQSAIEAAIEAASQRKHEPIRQFGDGQSDQRFLDLLQSDAFWNVAAQKFFIDREFN